MPMYNKKSAFLKGDRRNPCTYRVGRFEGDKYIVKVHWTNKKRIVDEESEQTN